MKKKRSNLIFNIIAIDLLLLELLIVCLAVRALPDIGKYDVTYVLVADKQGVAASPDDKVTETKWYSKDLTIMGAPGEREEYDFIGWNTKPDGSGKLYAPGDVYSANEDVTLYAQWQFMKSYASEEEIAQWMDVVKEQYEWSKDTPFGWAGAPTIENSREEATCIALPNVALQRLGIFESGEWFSGSKYGKLKGNGGRDKLLKRTDLFEVNNVNANIQDVKDDLREGDIVIFTTPHIMVFTGLDEKGRPLWYSTGRGTVKANQRIRYYEDKTVSHVVRFLHQPDNKLA